MATPPVPQHKNLFFSDYSRNIGSEIRIFHMLSWDFKSCHVPLLCAASAPSPSPLVPCKWNLTWFLAINSKRASVEECSRLSWTFPCRIIIEKEATSCPSTTYVVLAPAPGRTLDIDPGFVRGLHFFIPQSSNSSHHARELEEVSLVSVFRRYSE